MLFIGFIENKNYEKNYTFKLEIDALSANNEWFSSEKLDTEKTEIYEGIYTLDIFRDNKTIYSTDEVYSTFHPVEILQLINSNENWNVLVDDCYITCPSELDYLVDAIANQIADELVDSDNLDEYFKKSNEIFEDLINDIDLLNDIYFNYFDSVFTNCSPDFSIRWKNAVKWITENSCYNLELDKIAHKIISAYNMVEMFK